MAQRWPAPNVKPKLTQEEFDEAVKTNIEDFDMSPEEAVKSAVDEFQLQGYDMSCVVKTSAGGDLSKHPISLATQTISEAGTDLTAVSTAFTALQQLLDQAIAAGQEQVQQVSAVALKSSTLATVLGTIKSVSALENQSGTSPIIQAGLTVARTLMAPSVDVRDTFEEVGGPTLILTLHTQYEADIELQAELARCTECACFRQEQNKDKTMEAGYGVSVLQLLAKHCNTVLQQQQQVAGTTNGSQPQPTVHQGFIAAACGVLRSVTTADDDRPPCSKAFATARLLARQYQALKVLLSVLQLLPEASAAPTVAAVLSTVRQLAANDEICKDFSDDGGVITCLKLINSLSGESKDVVRCGLGALRQLTNSDHTKRLLAARGAAALLVQVSATHPGDAEVLEAALGVLANMTLRQPDAVVLCVEAGVIDWTLEAMREYPDNSLVQRQSSILIRNMVVRNEENRPVFLDKGAEGLLRAAKKGHPKNCIDVCYAAIRDLGLENEDKLFAKSQYTIKSA